MATSASTPPTTVIQPPRSRWVPDLRELWDRRELMYYLARRDITVRYKQAVVGFFWSILQPLMFAAVFGVFFGLLQDIPAPAGIPYTLFAASGMVMWLAFADGLGIGATSTVSASGLISKIYFPRLVIPIAAVAPAMVDLVIGFLVMIPVAWGFGFEPRPQLVLFPICLVLTFTITLGAALLFAAMNVRYRDVLVIVPFVTMIGLFISPIIYPITEVPESLHPIYVLNPVSGVMELWRYMLLPVEFDPLLLLISAGSAVVILISGLIYFTRAEPGFADVI